MPDKKELFDAMLDFYRRNMKSLRPVEFRNFVPQVEVQTLGHTEHKEQRIHRDSFVPQQRALRDSIRIDEVDPNLGPISGGTSVIIYGVHLDMNTVVDARNPRNNNHSTWTVIGTDPGGNWITCNTHQALGAPEDFGPWNLVVTDKQGQSATLELGWTYVDNLVLTLVSPNSGLITGGYATGLQGSGFRDGRLDVKFGGLTIPRIAFIDSTSVQLQQIPAHAAGVVDVTGTDIDTNQQSIIKGGWTYGTAASPGYLTAFLNGTPFNPNDFILDGMDWRLDEHATLILDLYWFDFSAGGNYPAIVATGYTSTVVASAYDAYNTTNSFMSPSIGAPIVVNAGKATGIQFSFDVYGLLSQGAYTGWPVIYFTDTTSGKSWRLLFFVYNNGP